MGRKTAEDLRDAIGQVRLETALEYHLTANHYPPLPVALVPVAISAIDAGNAGEYDKMIDLPKGMLFRGGSQAPASELIKSMHLDAFIDYPVD